MVPQFSQFERKDFAFLESVVGEDNVSIEESELLINATDALGGEWTKPDAVVWPQDSGQVSKIVSYANERRLPITPRGGGSSLSGNVVPAHHGIVLNFRRMNKIIEIFAKDLQVKAEPGVVYDELNTILEPSNLFFPPDPGSSAVCTIGGMIANNASGLGAVRYGVTRDYVIGLEVVLPNGNVISVGSRAAKSATGYDLIGLFVGSEGTLGVITEVTLKLRTLPPAKKTALVYFDSVSSAMDAVSESMNRGLNPAALEFLDLPTIVAVNRSKNLGLLERESLLLIEFHGSGEAIEEELKRALEICRRHGGGDIHEAADNDERKKLWTGRKAAYPSLLQSAPNVLIGDIVVPISRITEMLEQAYKIAQRNRVGLACFGHCGDGNIHPNILGNRADKELWSRVTKTNEEIVEFAIGLGGVSSGEHGIGIEKKQFMELQHGDSLGLMKEIKRLFDPQNIMNPGKFFDL
jgi:glycolate oxidase subunit GlcD